jgi:hypothetical protein
MKVILRLDNLECGNICKEINKLLKREKPDPDKNYLVIGLHEIVDSDNHIPKLEYKPMQAHP